MRELRVQPGFLGAEVGDPQAGGDARARQDDDVLGALEERDGVVEGVVVRQLDPFGELARDAEFEQFVVEHIRATLEEGGGADPEGGDEFSSFDGVVADGFGEEAVPADEAEAFSEGEGF